MNTPENEGFKPEIEKFVTDEEYIQSLIVTIAKARKLKMAGLDGLLIEAFQVDPENVARAFSLIWEMLSEYKYIRAHIQKGESNRPDELSPYSGDVPRSEDRRGSLG